MSRVLPLISSQTKSYKPLQPIRQWASYLLKAEKQLRQSCIAIGTPGPTFPCRYLDNDNWTKKYALSAGYETLLDPNPSRMSIFSSSQERQPGNLCISIVTVAVTGVKPFSRRRVESGQGSLQSPSAVFHTNLWHPVPNDQTDLLRTIEYCDYFRAEHDNSQPHGDDY